MVEPSAFNRIVAGSNPVTLNQSKSIKPLKREHLEKKKELSFTN